MTWNRPPIALKKRTNEATAAAWAAYDEARAAAWAAYNETMAAAWAAQNSHGEPRERR